MKVVLDSNVLIAAFATRGLCADILEYCLYQGCLVLSDYILQELHETLHKKIKVPEHKIHEIKALLNNEAKKIRPQPVPDSACRDKKDLMVLGTALAINADCLVTGDKDLLVLKKYNFIPILSPREFWQFIQKKK